MKLIFVIGAARSGTHLVGSSLSKSIEGCHYLAEINEFWNKYNKSRNVDYFDISSVDELLSNKIREDFYSLIPSSTQVVIEKTAANSLRVDLLSRVFPDAIFVHVIRDGRDVAQSVVRKVEGNPRKISSGKQKQPVPFYERFNFFVRRAKDKLSSETFSLSYMLRNIHYYCALSLTVLGVKLKKTWGPRYRVDNDSSLTVLESAWEQWDYCVRKADNDLSVSDNDHIEIKFEEILSFPERVTSKLSAFIKMDLGRNIYNIEPGVKEETNAAYNGPNAVIKKTLIKHGYNNE